MTSLVSIDGHISPPEHQAISPFDRGFTLGDGLFETIKLEHGIPWYLDRHLARLERSAQYIGIQYPDRLYQWIEEAIATSQKTFEGALVLRVTLTRGVSHIPGLAGTSNTIPTTVITIAPAPPIPFHVYEAGLSAHIASAPRNERAFAAGIKTTSYVEPILALREAKAAGYDDAIFLDSRGFVSEASASNVFAWIDEVLVTPPVDCGILPGITRAVILELATRRDIRVEERAFTRHELVNAREAFCTSSLRGIVPFVQIHGKLIQDGKPGIRTNQLIAEYTAHTARK